MTIPESVKEDIRVRAEQKWPVFPNKDEDMYLIERIAYTLALSEAWELMGKVYEEGYAQGLLFTNRENKTEFLNQIFKK